MPVIRLQDAMSELEVGTIVQISCTDPGVKQDIPAWCKINGHSLIDITERNDEIVIRARKDNND